MNRPGFRAPAGTPGRCFARYRISFASGSLPGYNRVIVPPLSAIRVLSVALVLLTASWASSCSIPVGPGYTIEQQTVVVHFLPEPAPRVEIRAGFTLRNTGEQPLKNLEIHLPPGDRAQLESVAVSWEAQDMAFVRQPDPEGDVLRIPFGVPWPVKQARSLRIDYVIVSGDPSQLGLAPDAFYLPPDSWLAAPMPPRGIYARGGAPPREWTLEILVPAGFAAQAAGDRSGQDTKGTEQLTRFQQHFPGITPFVVAGRYHTREFKLSPYAVHIWSKTVREAGEAQRLAVEVSAAAKMYDSVFGPREEHPRPLWIADQPVPGKELARDSGTGIRHAENLLAAPPEFAFLQVPEEGRSVREAEAEHKKIAASLAKRWLGYGLGPDPGLLPQPMGSLPAYAACLAREAGLGPQARREFIAEGLRNYGEEQSISLEIERTAGGRKKIPRKTDLQSPSKHLLFFFALEDHFGRDKLRAALQHMVQARRGRGYDLRDLISALEQETNRNVGEFVRGWVKHPGIPGDFRARYEAGPAQ